MTPGPLFAFVKHWGVVLFVGAAIILLAVLGRGLGLRWDPLNLEARRLDAARQEVKTASAEAAARTFEVEGAAAQARRVEHHHQQQVALTRATAAAEVEARNAHDAERPLDPDRAARLRDHDRELCRLAPTVCHPAPTDPAAGSGDALSAGPPD